jgi:hypothetical protein
LELTDDQIKNLTLTLIEKHMEKNRRSLKEFKGFPYPTDYVMEELGNRLIYDELNYDEDALKLEFKRLFNTLTGKVQIHWCYLDYF